MNSPNEIEIKFEEQFSENQNRQSDFLLKLLSLVGGVFFGYGYVMSRLGKEFELIDAYGILLFAVTILLSCMKLVYDLGFAMRRDQLVVFRIRRKYQLIAESEEDIQNGNKVFPYYFSPLKKFQFKDDKLTAKKKMTFFWMPALHNTISSFIVIGIFFLFATFQIKTNANWAISILMWLCSFICIIVIDRRKHHWLKRLYQEEFRSIQISDTTETAPLPE